MARPRDLTQEGAGGEECRRQVLRHRVVPPLERQLPHRQVLLRPHAGDRGTHIHRPERVARIGKEAIDRGLVGEVGLGDRCTAKLRRECPRPLLASVVVDQDARALGSEGARTRGSDPPGGTGHEHALPCQPGLHGSVGYCREGLRRVRHRRCLRRDQGRANQRRRADVRGVAAPLHGGDQRRRSRRQGGRRHRDRRHGLPRRRRRVGFQLAHPRVARRELRLRRAGRVDGVHGVPRGWRRRRAVRRHARDGRRPPGSDESHRLRPAVAEPLVQRHARRRDRHQRGALWHVGLPGADGHRRHGRVRRSDRPARARARDGAGEDRHHVAVGTERRAAARPGADRGRRQAGARRPRRRGAV